MHLSRIAESSWKTQKYETLFPDRYDVFCLGVSKFSLFSRSKLTSSAKAIGSRSSEPQTMLT